MWTPADWIVVTGNAFSHGAVLSKTWSAPKMICASTRFHFQDFLNANPLRNRFWLNAYRSFDCSWARSTNQWPWWNWVFHSKLSGTFQTSPKSKPSHPVQSHYYQSHVRSVKVWCTLEHPPTHHTNLHQSAGCTFSTPKLIYLSQNYYLSVSQPSVTHAEINCDEGQ